MRLQSGTSTSSIEEVKKFFEWIHQINDGKTYEPNDEYGEIVIPKEFLISHFNDPIEIIVTSTYSELVDNYKDSRYF